MFGVSMPFLKMTRVSRFFGLFLAFLAFSGIQISGALAQGQAIYSNQTRHHPVVAGAGMVVSQNAIASRVGAEILAQGGNAVDAAVAVGFALSVVLPRAGNLGGGGFMILYLAGEDKTIALDYRETAPEGASRDMFLDRNGNVDNRLTRQHHLSAGVPGTVAGLAAALRDYGSMSLEEVLAPAIRLAEDGITMSFYLSDGLKARQSQLQQNPASARKFYKEGGELYEPGELFVQPDLARTLKLIARDGAAAFYEGQIADSSESILAAGAAIVMDLEGQVRWQALAPIARPGEERFQVALVRHHMKGPQIWQLEQLVE